VLEYIRWTTLTGLNHHTSNQHIDLGTSRSNRDFHDLNSIQQWFDQHEPFDLTEHRLQSLSSGLITTADDCISCHKVEEIGGKIQNIRIISDASIMGAIYFKSEAKKNGVENSRYH